ncbi:MAG: ATP synthase subunit I [Acidobacteriaceae bacterium]|nr:ATP synthase subunit I [Acidobacteriaceae bacterium]
MTTHRLYRLTALFGLFGFIAYLWLEGPRSALGFLLGAAISLGNLWLFDRLADSIASPDSPRRPWQAGAFVGRYLVLFAGGYVIVKTLGVNPLPVVLGLFASTAAVLLSIATELLLSILGKLRPR